MIHFSKKVMVIFFLRKGKEKNEFQTKCKLLRRETIVKDTLFDSELSKNFCLFIYFF